MAVEDVIRHGAPTLAGLKTGNLLNPFEEGTVEKAAAHVIEESRRRY